MNIINKIKKFFSKEKSDEALQMWEALNDYDDYDGDPAFHPSLRVNARYALSLDDDERQEYLEDLVRRRNEACRRAH